MIPASLENAVYGLVVTPALHLADKHGLVARLVGDGPLTAEEVAAKVTLDPDTVDRLLLVLAAAGVLRRTTGNTYEVPADLVAYLDSADPHYIGGFVSHLVSDTADRMATLEAYLIKGKASVDAEAPGPYDSFYRDEESIRDFVSAMWHLSYAASQELARLSELTGSTMLVDVGGASGPFTVAALEQTPNLRAVVFDLPQVGPHAVMAGRSHGVADRITFVEGDFFRDELPNGDVVALGYVLSNWPDAECLELLSKVHRACAAGGRVLVMERLFDDDRGGPISTAVMNLEMHVETRGRHRTAAEYLEQLVAAGFHDCSVRRSSSDKHLIIGHRGRDDDQVDG